MVAEYDDSGQIGRRYRRQDEIGTPYALTIDDQTLEDDTVTIRDRDSLEQERIDLRRASLGAGAARRRLANAEGLAAPPLQRLLAELGEPELAVETVGVGGVEEPLRLREWPFVDGEADEADAEAAPAVPLGT